jgi:hypothetical protein
VAAIRAPGALVGGWTLPKVEWRDAVMCAAFIAGNAIWLSPMLNLGTLGSDARLYRVAAAAWLSGHDPWGLASAGPYHFAGLPPTVLAFAPTVALPPGEVAIMGVLVSAVSALWTVQRLRLPLWWVAFPPLVGGVWFANPDVLLLALLLGPLASIAPVLKVYAFVPLLLRPKQLVVGLIAFASTVGVAPSLWRDYLADAAAVSGRLVSEAHGGWSAWVWPPLVGLAVAGLVLLAARREWRMLAWLSVPALWPGSEFHYATMVLPVVTTAIGGVAAIPIPGLIALVPAVRALSTRIAAPPTTFTSRVRPGTDETVAWPAARTNTRPLIDNSRPTLPAQDVPGSA